jgi:hypothetical protein
MLQFAGHVDNDIVHPDTPGCMKRCTGRDLSIVLVSKTLA